MRIQVWWKIFLGQVRRCAESIYFLEVEAAKIHLPICEDLNGRYTFALGKMNPDHVDGDIPVMPLPSGDRISGIDWSESRLRTAFAEVPASS
jgi:hypothetical protein